MLPFPARRDAASSPYARPLNLHSPPPSVHPVVSPVVSPSVLLPSQSPRYTGHHAASLSLQHHRILLFSQSPRYTNQSTMDSWTEAQLRKMEAGGNGRLNSNAAAAAYRDRIAALAEGRPWTDPPVVKETPVLPRCLPGHQHCA